MSALRLVRDAIQYVAASGCAWLLPPKDFPPVSTVRHYSCGWRANGLLARINRALVAAARRAEGRNRTPSAGVIDRQSVKTAGNGGICGFDAGKRVKVRKRRTMTDASGHLIALRVHAAGIQGPDGAPEVFRQLAREAPKLRRAYADGGYAGPKLRDALTSIGRWVVERTFAWLGKCRRLAKDWEKTMESAEAWILIAHIRRLARALARA